MPAPLIHREKRYLTALIRPWKALAMRLCGQWGGAWRAALRRLTLAILMLVSLSLPLPMMAATLSIDVNPEPLLSAIFQAMEQQRPAVAKTLAEKLIKRFPTFQPGPLVMREIARGGDFLSRFQQSLSSPPKPINKDTALRAETMKRILSFRSRPEENQKPPQLLLLADSWKTVLLADTKASRLYLFQNDQGSPKLIADYYMSQGRYGAGKNVEGDKRTPLGVYVVRPAMASSKLPDLYGSGAFPLSYPNAWDSRKQRGGHGIWLHGSPSDTYARAPQATDGCVVLSNADLDALSVLITPNETPIIIVDGIDWQSDSAWDNARIDFLARFNQWKEQAESGETAKTAQTANRRKNINFAEVMHRSGTEMRNIGVLFNTSENYVNVRFSLYSAPEKRLMDVEQFWTIRDNRWQIALQAVHH